MDKKVTNYGALIIHEERNLLFKPINLYDSVSLIIFYVLWHSYSKVESNKKMLNPNLERLDSSSPSSVGSVFYHRQRRNT